jgi:site-specific recombinase XerD
LGIKSGFRISELLSLQVGDLVQGGKVADRVGVARAHMKKKIEGRCVILHPIAKAAIAERIEELKRLGKSQNETFLFLSAKGQNKALTRIGAWCVLKKAYRSLNLTGKLATHTMRKTFCGKIYDKLNQNIFLTAKAMGQKNVNSCASYLSFREEQIDEAVLSI